MTSHEKIFIANLADKLGHIANYYSNLIDSFEINGASHILKAQILREALYLLIDDLDVYIKKY